MLFEMSHLRSPRAGIVCIALVACGDNAKPPSDMHSGSRLKVTEWQFEDGTRQWAGRIYDSVLQTYCDGWGDEPVYCLPSSTVSVAYLDSSCTQPVGHRWNPCLDTPAYVYEDAPPSGGIGHLYKLGARIMPAAAYEMSIGGSCEPTGIDGYGYYAVTDEVPLSQFVQLEVGAPEGTGDLAIRYVTTSDGFRSPWSLHDTAHDLDCGAIPSRSDPSMTTCMPEVIYFTTHARDAACSVPVMQVPHGEPPPAVVTGFPICLYGDEPQFYDLDPVPEATPLYLQSTSTCSAATPDPTFDYYTASRPVSLPSLQRVADPTSGQRLQRVDDVTASGLRFPDSVLFDTQTGLYCEPTSRAPDDTRCAPVDTLPKIGSYFSDPACTVPLELVEQIVEPSGCAAIAPPRTVLDPGAGPNSCGFPNNVRSVGGPYIGPVYFNSGNCTPYVPTDTALFELGPVLPWTDFPSAKLVVDP